MLFGLAIAVANIDEVIRLIRTAPDPNSAREALMARDWPAHDIAPLIALIADPRHKLNDDGSYRLSEAQARAILDLRLQRLTALGRDEIGDELEEARGRDRRLPRHPALARAHHGDHPGGARADPRRFRDAAPDRDRATAKRTWTTKT